MSRRMPMAPVTRPPESRSADALSIVGNDLSRCAPWVEPHVSRHSSFDDLSQRHHELAGLTWAHEARQRLLDDLVFTKPQKLGHRVVGLEDLSLEVTDKDWIRRILDQALGVPPRLVKLTHVPQDLAVQIAHEHRVGSVRDDQFGSERLLLARIASSHRVRPAPHPRRRWDEYTECATPVDASDPRPNSRRRRSAAAASARAAA